MQFPVLAVLLIKGRFASSAAVMLLLMMSILITTRVQSCPLEIWTFDSMDHCGSVSQNVESIQPRSKGLLQADGTCQTTVALSTVPNTDGQPSTMYLPGTYSGTCLRDPNNFGTLQMWQSGCVDPTCSRPTTSALTCTRDLTDPASLYSRINPPGNLTVQDPSLRDAGFFSCFIQYGGGPSAGLSVTYAVFGDCNCIPPTAAPTRDPTPEPTQSPTTTAPTGSPTLIPTVAPPVATMAASAAATTTTTTTRTIATTPSMATTTTTTIATGEAPTVETTPSTPSATPSTSQQDTSKPTLRRTSSPSLSPSRPAPTDGGTDKLPTGGTSSSQSSLPVVAGGAIGGVLLLLVAAGSVWFFLITKHRRQKEEPIEMKKTTSEDQGTPPNSALSPNVASAPRPLPAAMFFPEMEIVCSNGDEVSTLGEPLGLDPHAYVKSDESTASVPMSYIREMTKKGGGFMYPDGDALSRTEASGMSTATEIDPDKFILPTHYDDDDDGEGSLEEVYRRPQGPPSAPSRNVTRFQVSVPPGRLGMLLDAAEGIPTVNMIKPDSVFTKLGVKVGDHLIAVDDVEVRGMAAIDVSQLIVMKARQPRRLFTFERSSPRKGVDVLGEDEHEL